LALPVVQHPQATPVQNQLTLYLMIHLNHLAPDVTPAAHVAPVPNQSSKKLVKNQAYITKNLH